MTTSRRAIVVGGDHGYQFLVPGGVHERGALEMQQEILRLAQDRAVAGIVEEACDDAIKIRNVQELAGRYAAKRLGLPHLMCDLNFDEREALGVRSTNEIAFQVFMNEWGQDRADSLRRSQNYEPREREWIARIMKWNVWPCLFICGADHVESFSAKLAAEDVEVEVIHWDWLPSPQSRVHE